MKLAAYRSAFTENMAGLREIWLEYGMNAINGLLIMTAGVIVTTLGIALLHQTAVSSITFLWILMIPVGIQVVNLGYHRLRDTDEIPLLKRIVD